jgi:hypothetical protein
MATNENKEKTAVAKLRERYYEIKRSIKPSEKLKDALKKERQPAEEKEDSNKKVARPHNEADL